MKLCRYGKAGYEKPGMIDGEGRLRDLSKVVDNIGPNEISPRGLKMLSKVKPESLPPVNGNPRFGVPYVGIGKFVAIGLNYSDHAKEAGLPIPAEPIVFMKATTCISGPNDDVMLPKGSTHGDWEVELGVVIGKTCRYVDRAEALDHVAGYAVTNDVSERAFQAERAGQWTKGKSCDNFGQLGPWLVTRDEVADPQDLTMWLNVNGEIRQNGSTRTMVYGVRYLVSYLSQFMTLYPGDVISTGTPPGVGLGMKPPQYLRAGDVVELEVDALGKLANTIVAEESDWSILKLKK